VQTYEGATQSLRIPDAITAGLKRVESAGGRHVFHDFAAAFNVLLHRCTGENDIVVGVPERQSQSKRAGKPHRFLREHAALARRFVGQPTVPRSVGGASVTCASMPFASQDVHSRN